MVELAGEPIARVQEAAGLTLSSTDKATKRKQLATAQAVVESGIQALGGTVKARYRDAYNGLRVRISSAQVPALQKLPGVVRVHRAQVFQPNNVAGAQRIAAPGAWTPLAGVGGYRGEGVKIAIIDSGIDYTHADFGGPGTPEAYNAAFAAGAQPADPALFGPGSPKVKGGFDFAGDAYDANSAENDVPAPDANPLDCGGHGTHVAGSTAGFGVLANGSRFSGPYNDATYNNNAFLIGPGVAPAADLYALRVFGCDGSTNLVVDALDWAVANDMDVVNMSLGSSFGRPDDPTSVAADNAAAAGIVVVASAGNSGAVSYITGSPAASSRAISVAAQDPTPSYPGALIAAAGAAPTQSINANGAVVTQTSLQIKLLLDAAGNLKLGCDPADYQDVAGKLVVTKRGTCARTSRAIYGQAAGAAAVLMVNNANSLPPFEGPITQNADTGEYVTVTIPFFGVS
ncbi:MAG TPA: S8 family serine peptidase, partial [Kofleriaceae bacterium]|nr:S8 family serine peptidase [Kofleriaceae bacterium]